jgi:polysaccharide biosynthesis/export protein
MYDLIASGDKSKDARLLPGDIIYIPAVGSQVAISGSVNTSAIFEIKPNDSLKSLLQWNGGLTSTALGKKFNIERIKDKQDRSVEEFDYSTMATSSFKLQNGDFIRVYNISPKIDNAITVRGNVAQAQRFAWTAGMHVLDVIPTQESVLTRNYWVNKNQKANQYSVDEVKLKNELSNQIADINWDYAAIERYNPKDFTTDLISFNLGKAVIERDPANNLELHNGDVITLFSKEDIRVPTQKQSKYVYLEGEVTQPGVYKIAAGETLKNLLQRTGGITANAYLYGSSFTRTSTYRQQQDRLDAVRSRLLSDIDESTANAIKDATTPDAIAAAKAIAEENKKVLNRMTSGKASGRIVLELPTKANSVDQFPDIMLEDNDRLYIPTPSATVSVMGLVYNENSYLYKPGRNYEDYIALAGSTTREADTGNIYILRADGSVLNKRQSNWLLDGFSSTEIQPGDTIVVPNKISTTSLVGSLKDWTSIIGQFLLGAAALRSLK